MKYNEKIVALRKANGFTQEGFARAVGVTRQAVYKWEVGDSYPEAEKLIAIKQLFGISIDDLLDDSFDVIVEKAKKPARKKTLPPSLTTPAAEAPAAEAPAAEAPAAPAPAPVVEEPVAPAPAAPVVEEKPAPAPVVEEKPAPAPVVEEKPAPAPVVEEKPAPSPAPKKAVEDDLDEFDFEVTENTGAASGNLTDLFIKKN